MLTAILKQFTENQKKLPVLNTMWQLQRTYLRGWWMTVGLVTWRESCVGTGFSWKLCTASAGKSAWPLTGAPEIVNDLGGLETMWTPNKCTDHPSMKDLFFVLCPIQKPNNSNVLYKLWSYPSCYLGSQSTVLTTFESTRMMQKISWWKLRIFVLPPNTVSVFKSRSVGKSRNTQRNDKYNVSSLGIQAQHRWCSGGGVSNKVFSLQTLQSKITIICTMIL